MTVEQEDADTARDSYALLCKVPHALDDEILDTVMKSKSRRMEYKVTEVVGKSLGRVQYFLNKTFVQLLEERRIKSVHGLVC